MPSRRAEAEWHGNLRAGGGRIKVGSGAFGVPYSFDDRFANGMGTNPEELIGAAHAGCFTMALATDLTLAGHPPDSLKTTAMVTIDKVGDGFAITKIELATEGKVPGVDDAEFKTRAETSKNNCPVSKALTGTTITLTAKLTTG